jgi:hypothetical protein
MQQAQSDKPTRYIYLFVYFLSAADGTQSLTSVSTNFTPFSVIEGKILKIKERRKNTRGSCYDV